MESLNTLSDINFDLKICIKIEFHRYDHVKYQFVWKYNKKSLWKFGRIWTDFGVKSWMYKRKDFFINLHTN